MAALTTNTDLFASRAASCPATFMKMVNYNRTVDFKKLALAASTNYELLALPKGFVAQYVTFVQKKASSSGVAITVKDKSGNHTISSSYTTKTEVGCKVDNLSVEDCIFNIGDIICLCTGSSVPADGVVEIGIVGFQASGYSLDDVEDGVPPYAVGQTDDEAAQNKSGGDPMFVPPNLG